jgi:hypothetical protein
MDSLLATLVVKVPSPDYERQDLVICGQGGVF